MDCDVLGTMGMSPRPLDRFWVSAWDACLKKVSVCFSLWADSTRTGIWRHTPSKAYLSDQFIICTNPSHMAGTDVHKRGVLDAWWCPCGKPTQSTQAGRLSTSGTA